jgi:dolichol kinase
MDKELKRQLFHAIVGVAVLFMLFHYGRGFAIAAVFSVIMMGMLLMNMRLQGGKLSLIRWFEEQFERSDAPLPGWGSACYAAGVLMLLTFLTNPAEIAACVIILAIGDAFSTIIGTHGTHHIPYNKGKTLEGSVVFFLTSMPAYYFIGPLAIPLVAVATVVETLPKLEDNFTIPIACVIFLLIF